MSEASDPPAWRQAPLGRAGQPARPARPLRQGRPAESSPCCSIAVLAIAPFDQRGDVSFILDKKEVDKAPSGCGSRPARYSGEDNRGQQVRDHRRARRPADAPTSRSSTSRECWRGARAGAGAGDDRRQPGALRPRHAYGRRPRAGAGRRAGRLSAGNAGRHASTSRNGRCAARDRRRAPCGSASSRRASSAPISASEDRARRRAPA